MAIATCIINIYRYIRCESTVTQVNRISDKQKLYECDLPDCFKIFESVDKLSLHKYYTHNLQISIDPNLLKQENHMGSQISMQRYQMMPFQNMPGQNMMNASGNLFMQPASNFPNIQQ